MSIYSLGAYDRIRACWQGTDLPNNAEILEAAERYRDECETKYDKDISPFTIGRQIGWIEGLSYVVARSPRDCWAHLFKRPMDASQWKRQGS